MMLRFAFLSALTLISTVACAAEQPPAKRVEEFQLKDFRGTEHALADYRDSKLVVLAFLGTECPLAKLYGARLAELAKEYEPRGVQFLGVNANVQDSITEIAAYARVHEIEFPILKDVANQLADAVGAVRTPEVFVLDADRDGAILRPRRRPVRRRLRPRAAAANRSEGGPRRVAGRQGSHDAGDPTGRLPHRPNSEAADKMRR